MPFLEVDFFPCKSNIYNQIIGYSFSFLEHGFVKVNFCFLRFLQLIYIILLATLCRCLHLIQCLYEN